MLETGSPLEDEKTELLSVSPPAFDHASRSSSPGISSLDGTPRYLFNSSIPPPTPRSASAPPDMAVRPKRYPENGHDRTTSTPKPDHVIARPNQKVTNAAATEDHGLEGSVEDRPSHSMLSLSELGHLSRLERYQSWRSRQSQTRLYDSHVIAARTSRLLHTARSVQRIFAECIRSEDKPSFVNLFGSFQEALSECSDQCNGHAETEWTTNKADVGYPASFIDALQDRPRTALLDFLTKIRHDGQFVADRIAALTHQELISLLPGKGLSKSNESILAFSPRASSRISRDLGFVVDGQTELISSSHFANPLDVLIHSVRDVSSRSLHEDAAATQAWATVCARLITDQKPGSEKFVPAVIDAWSSSCAWQGRRRLELWISQILHDGSFLLDQPSRQSFMARVQGRSDSHSEDHQRAELFYANAVKSLLDLLSDQDGASVIPEGVQSLCGAICRKLQHSPGHRHAFPSFVATRWLFSSFLPDTITLPEIFGLITDVFIVDSARQRILREISNRCQKVVFDVVYSWKLGNAVSPEYTQLVSAVINRLPGSCKHESASQSMDETQHKIRAKEIIAVSVSDVTMAVNALYPPQRPTSLSERDVPSSGLHSSASSVSGFSLFQTPVTPEHEPGLSRKDIHDPSSIDSGGQTTDDDDDGQRFSLEGATQVLHANLESDQLREACSGIEDLLANTDPQRQRQFCGLVTSEETGKFCTTYSALCETWDPSSMTNHAKATGRFWMHDLLMDARSAKCAIEDLISKADENLLPELLLHEDLKTPTEIGEYILQACKNRVRSLEERFDFVAAHTWSQKMRCLDKCIQQGGFPESFMEIMENIKVEKEGSLRRSFEVMQSCDALALPSRTNLMHYVKELDITMETARRLRDKMWYTADVRTSAAYDQARAIANALKVMGKPRRPLKSRLAPPLRRWSGPKVSSTNLHLKTEAQVLELLCAPQDYGGPNKLSDDQSKALQTWMESNNIDNFCKGEERLHRLCMEIQRTVDQVTADGSVTRSSALFAGEKLVADPPQTLHNSPLWPLSATNGRFNLLSLGTHIQPANDITSNASSHPLSTRSSRDYLESRSPTLTNKSSVPFWSPTMTEAQSPSTATSVGSTQTQAALGSKVSKQRRVTHATGESLLDVLRQRTGSLLLSDLTSSLFNGGCETDGAFWQGLGGQLAEKHCRSLSQDDTNDSPDDVHGFDFEKAFGHLMRQFSATCNPSVKLARLLDIDKLLGAYATQQTLTPVPLREASQSHTDSLRDARRSTMSKGVDSRVEGFRRLFISSTVRPACIFRDLQYIASLIPHNTLESTPQGKAFWNAAVALSGLKQEIRSVMVETADSIIAFQSNNRGHGRSSSVAQQERDSATFSVPTRTPSAEDIAHYTMADAAHLLQIAAKEGDAAAQRELATLYLTHPEQLDHVIAPLSRPRDVFKAELERKWRKDQDPNRCDPVTMCVAHHWMSLSSKGGDALATEFLRQREEMERLP